jgi:hypothetical protein
MDGMARTGRLAAAFAVLAAIGCRERNPGYRVAGLDAPAALAESRGGETARATPDRRAPDAAPSPREAGVPDGPGPEAAATEVAREGPPRPPEAGASEAAAAAREYHTLECEAGQIFGAMVRGSDPAAFGGAYVHVPPGPPNWSWDAASPALPPDRVELPVALGAGGSYVVWVRYWTVGNLNDAWYAGFDKADLRRFYYNVAFNTWVWTRHTDGPDRLQFNDLAPGRRTLILGRGESGPRCDRVLVTNDLQFVPSAVP